MNQFGTSGARRQRHLHPVLIMLVMMFAAVALTHMVPAGKFDRHEKEVIPGSYHVVSKVNGLPALLSPTAPSASDSPARAAGVVALFAAIPAGMVKQANLVFMVMFMGGLFGIMRATGVIDAAIDRLLHLTSGNTYLLTTGLMALLACGATFLGFISEYLVIIPLMLELGRRLRLPDLFAPAVVVVAGMIGYASSVTNPIVLAVAQPLAGVPVFSGLVARLALFVVMFVVGLGYVLFYLRGLPKIDYAPAVARLTVRHAAVLVWVVLGGAALIAGTGIWSWGSPAQSAAFIAFSIVLAFVGGLRPAAAADAFLNGMSAMLLAGLMIGLAGAMQIILQSSQVLDSIVQGFANLIQGHARSVVATDMMGAEMMLDVLIHSTSAKAAISMPILAPIAQLAGVSGQVIVTALLLGGGLTNMVTPTNGLLLAFLAAAKVDYVEWCRFIVPLFAILCVVGIAALYLMTVLGV